MILRASDPMDSRSVRAIFTAARDGSCVFLSCSEKPRWKHFGFIDSFKTDHADASVIATCLRPVRNSLALNARSLTLQS